MLRRGAQRRRACALGSASRQLDVGHSFGDELGDGGAGRGAGFVVCRVSEYRDDASGLLAIGQSFVFGEDPSGTGVT